MDGARIPLMYPSFNADIWEAALGSYFDAEEIVDAIRFGWDVSFFEQPNPKPQSSNSQSMCDTMSIRSFFSSMRTYLSISSTVPSVPCLKSNPNGEE